MRKFLFSVAALLCCFSSFAGYNNFYSIHGTTWALGTVATDKLSNVVVEVTPKGLYAKVDLTFLMEGTALTGALGGWANLQGSLDFELPPNSFIQDSWLWFDDTTILYAHIIDKGRAQEIYNGIVSRSCDPSLLIKTGENTYNIHVFPLRANFPRKVRISYSTLITYKDNNALVTLPTDIFCASNVKPALTVVINKTAQYSSPDILEDSYASMILSSNTTQDVLTITPDKYSREKELNLRYQLGSITGINYYSSGTNNGIYELFVPAENNNVAPKHLSFVLDPADGNSHASIGEMKKSIRTFLLTECSDVDSFNIIYPNGINTVQQTSTGWLPSNNATILSALNTIPESNVINDPAVLSQMLIAGYQLCQQKPVADAQCILMSGSNSYSTQQESGQLMGDLMTGVGSLTHKFSTISLVARPFLTQITQGSGGREFGNKGTFFNEFTFNSNHDISPKQALKELLYDMYEGTPYCDLTLPVSTGIILQREKLTPGKKYYPGRAYMESGKYYGQLSSGTATFEYLTQNSVATRSESISSPFQGDEMIKKGWINSYITTLEDANAMSYHQQILDSSINNRVLSRSTAFLALEPADSMWLTGNPNVWQWPLPLDVTSATATDGVRVYPNPFSTQITIESSYTIDELTITDITGKIVYSGAINSKSFTWAGTDADRKPVVSGIYIVKLKGKNKTDIVKLSKI